MKCCRRCRKKIRMNSSSSNMSNTSGDLQQDSDSQIVKMSASGSVTLGRSSSPFPLSSHSVPTATTIKGGKGKKGKHHGHSPRTRSRSRTPVTDPSAPPNPNYNWDALYDDTTDNASHQDPSSSNDSKQTVISYLWSQLKIGMDLTKITLPTYILERRSLLEMYADFFAHPDMFVAVADAPNPKERLIAVTKWYLASFHAGRKSDVAKKPYNPMLGEVFTCWWTSVGTKGKGHKAMAKAKDLRPRPSDGAGPSSSSVAGAVPSQSQPPKFNAALIHEGNRAFFSEDGTFLPFSYDSGDTLVFFGEQVSHHPPISAFYAEHVNKNISLTAQIWTKSKFLGLSVAVHNIGEAVLRVQITPNSYEEYTIGFPSGYGRSILSVPWFELGGEVPITCAQTGYNATVEFCTKGIFGSSKNRIVTKLFSPSEGKKPFMVIEGTWNDVMERKEKDKYDKFLDVKGLHIWKKETRKVVDQEAFESRRLWKDVTKALKYNDVDGATFYKKYLEDKQRSEAKEREHSKVNWRPRMFTKSGENKWVFLESLEKRRNN